MPKITHLSVICLATAIGVQKLNDPNMRSCSLYSFSVVYGLTLGGLMRKYLPMVAPSLLFMSFFSFAAFS